MKYISERVSIDRRDDRFSVVISPRLTRGKQSLLITWTTAWTLCGLYIFYERTQLPPGDQLRQYLLAFLAFWAYFEIRIGRVLIWRLKGFELWRLKNGRLTIKDSIFGLGRANDFFVQNIQKLGAITIDPTSWKWQMNDSFWVMGGERLGFEHLGKKMVFGKGLNEEEVRQLLPMLKDALRAERKRESV